MKQQKVGKRVLLVEPNPIVRTLLSCFLNKERHLVALHSQYETALHALQIPVMLCFPPHVALISMQARERDCMRILVTLLHEEAYRETRLIVMMREEERKEHDVQRLLQLLKARIVIKPIQVQEVLELVVTSS